MLRRYRKMQEGCRCMAAESKRKSPACGHPFARAVALRFCQSSSVFLYPP